MARTCDSRKVEHTRVLFDICITQDDLKIQPTCNGSFTKCVGLVDG